MKLPYYFVLAAIILAIVVIDPSGIFLAAEQSSEPTRMHFTATNQNNEDDWK